jgi:hypothetical protein
MIVAEGRAVGVERGCRQATVAAVGDELANFAFSQNPRSSICSRTVIVNGARIDA